MFIHSRSQFGRRRCDSHVHGFEAESHPRQCSDIRHVLEYLGYYGRWEDPYEEGGINLCYGDNSNNLPCEVTIYGLKDDEQVLSTFETMNTKDGWVKLGTFKQDKNLPNKEMALCDSKHLPYKDLFSGTSPT